MAFCDGPIASTSAVTLDATVSKLGGSPRFWPCVGSPYPSHEELVCTICNRLLPLVAQLYIPLAEAEDRHRALYVFACVTKECQKKEGWCILDSFASHADRSHWHSVRAFTASRWDAALAADYDARQAAEKKKEEEARAAAERAKSPVNPFVGSLAFFGLRTSLIGKHRAPTPRLSTVTTAVTPSPSPPSTLLFPQLATLMTPLLRQQARTLCQSLLPPSLNHHGPLHPPFPPSTSIPPTSPPPPLLPPNPSPTPAKQHKKAAMPMKPMNPSCLTIFPPNSSPSLCASHDLVVRARLFELRLRLCPLRLALSSLRSWNALSVERRGGSRRRLCRRPFRCWRRA